MYRMRWVALRFFFYTVIFTVSDVCIRHRPFLSSLLYSAIASAIALSLVYGAITLFKRIVENESR